MKYSTLFTLERSDLGNKKCSCGATLCTLEQSDLENKKYFYGAMLSLSLVSLATAMVFFLVSISTAFAQTPTQFRPGAIDINNVRSERLQDIPQKTPTTTLFKKNKDVRRVDSEKADVRAIKIRTEGNAANKLRTFLDRARTVLQERRQGTSTLRNIGEAKEERTLKLEDRKKERISKFLNNIKRKMDAAISRLLKLSKRIESRIVKFEERGIDMTQARRLLEVAKDSIANAVESIATAIENAQKALRTDISRNSFGSVVSELTKTKESLRNAHKSLVEVIRIMKANLPTKSNGQGTNPNTTETGQTN